MRIPTGNFGNVVPTVRQGSAAFDNTQVERAAQNLAQTGQGIAMDMAQKQDLENQQIARVRASNMLLDRETQLDSIRNDLQEKARTGQLSHDQIQSSYETAVGQLAPLTPKGLDPAEVESFGGSLKRLQANGAQRLQPVIREAQIGEAKQDIDGRMDVLGKAAGMPGADPAMLTNRLDSEDVDAAGRMAYGLDWDKHKQDFKDGIFYTNALQRAGAAKNDMGQLKQLEHDLSAEDGFYTGKLDANRRTTALNQIMGFQTQLENRQMAAQARREAAAQRAIYRLDQQVSSGVMAPAGFMDGIASQVKGTPYEADFKDAMADQTEIQRVKKLNPPQQMDFLQKREQELMQNGGTVRDVAQFNRLSTSIKSGIQKMQTEPLLWSADQEGTEVQPLDVASLITGGDTSVIAGQLQQRLDTLQAMQKHYGGAIPTKPLLPQEAAALTSGLQQATPRQQGQLFGVLKQAFGSDDKAYQGAMQQIAPDAPVKALAGMIYSKQKDITLQNKWFGDNVTANGGDVADTMLTGENILNKTKADKATDGKSSGFPIPKEQDFRLAFSKAVGNVFAGRPEAFDVAMQAVRSYYTGKAAQEGDVSGEVDTKRMKQAITASIGRPISVGNGNPVLAPWGMDEDTFHAKAQASFEQQMRQHEMPEALTNNFGIFGLENRSGDTYRVVQGGDYLRDKKGQPIIINVNGDAQ